MSDDEHRTDGVPAGSGPVPPAAADAANPASLTAGATPVGAAPLGATPVGATPVGSTSVGAAPGGTAPGGTAAGAGGASAPAAESGEPGEAESGDAEAGELGTRESGTRELEARELATRESEPAGSTATGEAEEEDRPATYKEVFASREFRAVYFASAQSWVGDYLAKAAVTAMVFHDTHSPMLAAAAFAITYLPWITGGPVLAALAERYPFRTVMITCDLARMVLIGLVAVPHIPLPALLALLFATSLLTPPFEASRSALLPRMLAGDRYVVGLTVLHSVTGQTMQVAGYMLGGVLAAVVNPRWALAFDALTFGLSALLIRFGLRYHPAAVPVHRRTRLLKETAEGFKMVFGHPVMRPIALLVFSVVGFAIVPEGIAAVWAREAHSGPAGQGLIMAAHPIGVAIGGVVVGRLLAPSTRRKLIRPLSMVVPLVLIGALFNPPLPVVVAIAAVGGLAMSGVLAPSNGLFVQVLPEAYRARSFGVMQGGLQIAQGAAVFITGAIVGWWTLPRAVAAWGLFGLVLMVVLSLTWPSAKTIGAQTAVARAANEAAAAADSAAEQGTSDQGAAEHGLADQGADSTRSNPTGTDGDGPGRPGSPPSTRSTARSHAL